MGVTGLAVAGVPGDTADKVRLSPEGIKAELWALRGLILEENGLSGSSSSRGPGGAAEAAPTLATLTPDDLFCAVVKVGYGKGGLNPVSELTTFYLPAKVRHNPTLPLTNPLNLTLSPTHRYCLHVSAQP